MSAQLTGAQRRMMEHATATSQKISFQRRGYRNKYVAALDTPAQRDWENLCERGLARRHTTWNSETTAYYMVTEAGLRAMQLPEKLITRIIEDD